MRFDMVVQQEPVDERFLACFAFILQPVFSVLNTNVLLQIFRLVVDFIAKLTRGWFFYNLMLLTKRPVFFK